jgi:peptide/nickel transport system substrate-binding protein
LKLWREIFLFVITDAPWAPVFNEQRLTFRSDRLDGSDALFIDPVPIPIHHDEVYARDAQ